MSKKNPFLSSLKKNPDSVGVNPDHMDNYDTFDQDVIGNTGDDAPAGSDSDDDYDREKSGKKRAKKFGQDEEEEKAPYMFFDFRRGTTGWPSNVEYVDQKRADDLLDKATAAAEEAAKAKKKDGDEEGGKKDSMTGISWDSVGMDAAEDEPTVGIHPEATFETLKDGSTALLVKPGYRLKLKLNELLEGGDEKKEERAKKEAKAKKRAAEYSKDVWGIGPSMDVWGGYAGSKKKWFKEVVNEYTITMDIKIVEELPREGASLFQTALIHSKENKRTGKTTLSRSDGECVINQSGGVGMFGTYGDTTKAKVEVGYWKRVVVAVKCSDKQKEKGEMRTWVGSEAGVVLKEESITAGERFSLDPDNLYLFSSAQNGMMPGGILIRTVRVEKKFATDQDVKANRALDKVLSRFDEERKKEVEEQRKGLSLAPLFPKPRPMWVAPAFVAIFGDAFIEKTTLEGSSNLAWSYTVLNFALQKMLKQPLLLNESFGLTHSSRVGLSDTLHVMQQSAPVFKLMLRMLKTPTESQLLNFLRKVKKFIQAVSVGESLLLPAIVEGRELIILVERTNERLFRFVIIQTDPLAGLNHHSMSPAISLPEIRYRTCMVLNGISKKNATDDVFWMALYNMAIHVHRGDTDRFYDVLIPFLTGKPLEASLVEAETADLSFVERKAFIPSTKGSAEEKSSANDEVTSVASNPSTHTNPLDLCGPWRSPQRSNTAYVRCFAEALYYLLKRKGVSELEANQINLCLCIELVNMMKNDISFILPDDNGVRVCSLALRELSHFAVKVVDQAESLIQMSSGESKFDPNLILKEVHTLVGSTTESLEFCKNDDNELPPSLDLTGCENANDPNDPALTQFRDLPCWDVLRNDPDPGQAVALRKYVPVDLLQIPKKANTRVEAITAIRMTDRLCSLLDNQSHCIKNDKFLIISVIEHVFTQVIPVPKARGVGLSEAELKNSDRSKRREDIKAAEEAIRLEEKKKRIEEKQLNKGVSSKESKENKETKEKTSKSSSTTDEVSAATKPKFFGEEILPDFEAGKVAEAALLEQYCMWDEEIGYELQVELLITLQRITEHFAAAAMSINQSRPFDAVCIIVSGCLAALSDAIIRKIATDEPSEMCSHLMGKTITGRQLGHPGYGISVGTFATQSETLEIHSPELSIARTAVLDYFQSPQQRRLEKIFSWEEDFVLKPGKPLIQYLRMVAREIGLPISKPHCWLLDYNPISSQLIKNYPELKCYRDVVFWWKYFLNTDRKAFKNYVNLERPTEVARIGRMDAQLTFNWDEQNGGYQVVGFGVELRCRPDPKQTNPVTGKVILPEHLPTHRFPSSATPSFYVPLPTIKTEDDVIYRPNLPSFEDKYGQVLNQRDSELLISYLTVPYMRVPLIMSFFSSEDRIHKLQSAELRLIFDSVMFEPGKYLRIDMGDIEPMMVPTPHTDLLASPYGLLLNELCRSPDTIIRSIVQLLKGALACDTGSVVDEDSDVFNASTTIILYLTRLGSRTDNYISFLIDYTTGKHDCIDWPLRESEVSDETLQKLIEGRNSLRELLHEQFNPLFEDYLRRLDAETSKDPNNERLIDRNSRLACDIHSHKLLFYRNYHPEDITNDVAKTLVGGFVYLTTRHTWNKSTTEGARLSMPETELYELLQISRRRLVEWIGSCRQGVLDEVMQTALQVSSSLTGSFKASAEILDNQNRWSRIKGDRSVGRWAVGSTRTVAIETEPAPNDSQKLSSRPKLQRQMSIDKHVGEVADNGMLGVEIDVQMGQMTLRSKHLAALETNIANHPDVTLIFGDATMQASLIEKAEHRQRFRLVGLNHELEYWPSSHTVCPPLGDEWEREYDPADLFDSERWIASLFEPVRKSFFDGPSPPPMQFMMTEKATPDEAEVAIILGLHQNIGGPFKLVYLFRRLRCLHIYECVSQGREWWFSLHMTTDNRYCLRDLQPSTRPRNNQYPDWWIRGAGAPYPMGVNDYLVNDIEGTSQYPHASVIVLRETQHKLNLSGGKEKLVPSRFLFGLVPEALLTAYIFWQDESLVPRGTSMDSFGSASRGYKRLRGYPVAKDGEYIIIIEFTYTGSWQDYFAKTVGKNSGSIVESNGFPGRTINITRKLKVQVEAEFEQRKRIASTLESFKLLIPPTRKKKVEDEDNEKGDIQTFKVDTPVECNYEGKDEYWPCVVRRVNDDGTYDLEYVNDYKWVGIQRGVDPEQVQKRGEGEKKKRGEGIWHWDGMSEDEDDDWREGSEAEDDGENQDDRLTKDRLSFYQFDELRTLLDVVEGSEEKCIEGLTVLHKVRKGVPFNDLHSLASALKDTIDQDKKISLGPSDVSLRSPAADFEKDDMILMNILYAPRRSRLHSLMKVLCRIETAGHICAWTKASKVPKKTYGSLQYGCPSIDLVELPRLKLAFTARPDHEGVLRLYSVDHVDLFITNESNAQTAKMLAGIPHSLILSNVRGETQILVPVIPPIRPQIFSQPFTTFIVLNRSKIPLAERFFLYPVHISLSFLLTKGLNSALYLMLLRFLHRDYADVFRISDSIATDNAFNAEGLDIFLSFKNTNDDWYPDAHACRLKISLVTIDSGMESPWDLTIECARHIVKLDCVSSNCRLAPAEELQLLETDFVVTSSSDAKFNKDKHDEYSMALCYNRKQQLRSLLQNSSLTSSSDDIKILCKAPPRSLNTNWPYYQDNTVFGENYLQMRDITMATEGEHSWIEEVKGGDETDAPPGGWLVVAVFHTLWSAGCIKVMPAVTELVPMYQDMMNFVSVKADCQGMVGISKSLNVTVFPTFIIFRGGKELERLEGHEKAVEKLVRSLSSYIGNDDKVCHAKQRHRLRLEKALALGQEVPEEEQPEEQGQLDWTFDPEQCGEGMTILDDGMRVILADEHDKDSAVIWEYSYNNRSWKPFTQEETQQIEKKYKSGGLYGEGYLNMKNYELYLSNVVITDYDITGIMGTELKSYRDVYVRRGGDRLQVPNEENYLSKEQKERDKRSAEWRDKIEAYKKKMREQRIGKDIECMRGTIGFLPNTGVHFWHFKWNHEPARGGKGDAFGVCGDAKEEFGAGPTPALGGADTGVSLGLYADGSLYHNGKLINSFVGKRGIKAVEPGAEPEPPKKVEEDGAPPSPEKKKTKKLKKSLKKVDIPEVQIPQSPLFGQNSMVKCVLDTGLDGGTLSFYVDSYDGLEIPVVVLSGMYAMLGGSEIFPCICLSPPDSTLVDELTQNFKAREEAEKNPSSAAPENDDENDSDDEEVDEQEMLNKLIGLRIEANFEKKGVFISATITRASPEDFDLTYDDGKVEKNILHEDLKMDDAIVEQLMSGEITVEQANVLMANVKKQTLEDFLESLKPSVTLLLYEEMMSLLEKPPNLPPDVPKPIDEVKVEEKIESEIVAPTSDAVPAASVSDVAIDANAAIAVDSSVEPPPVPEEEKQAEDAKVVEVPVEKVRWMYETNEESWKIYSPDASKEIEEAQRDGKTEYTITIGEQVHKLKLDVKLMTRSDIEGEFRMRRHVVGDGLAGMWEMLTMKYEKPQGLSGMGVLKILEKVWNQGETMSGKQSGFGFLFLYSLLSGESKLRVTGGYGDWGGSSNYKKGYSGVYSYGGKSSSGSSSSNDAHRFALLLTQLFTDRHTKSLPASVINVLGRNRQVSLRMPKFKDSRKAMHVPYFNGWVDEVEPRSPLAELFAKIVPVMTVMKRKGAFHFPPPPPHLELPAPPTSVSVGEDSVQSLKSLRSTIDWDRPELSDYGCESRVLEPIEPTVVKDLVSLVQFRFSADALKPMPPLHIEDTTHFENIIKKNPRQLYIIDFFASWCGPCKALAPLFRLLAQKTPVATFLKVDVDECDDLAAKFQIESMPTIIFLRGGYSPHFVLATLKPAGVQFMDEFSKLLSKHLTSAEVISLEKFHSNAPGENVRDIMKNITANLEQIDVLATQPLLDCYGFIKKQSRKELGMGDISSDLPFDVSGHDAANTAPATSVLNRFKDDIAAYAHNVNTSDVIKVINLSDRDINNYFLGDEAAAKVLQSSLTSIRQLANKLHQLKKADSEMIRDTIPLLERAVNWVALAKESAKKTPSLKQSGDDQNVHKIRFLLNRYAGQNSSVWIEFLFGSLLSSKGEDDLLKLNPYISDSTVTTVLSLVKACMLRANRLGHTNRCIGTVISLESLLDKALKVKTEDLVEQGKVLTPKLIQVCEEIANTITMARHYMTKVATVKNHVYSFDPRYLVFEFVWNIQLRKKQVEIVNDFRSCLEGGRSKVKQMIMGAGKTSVVAPLLALIVADGKSLVLSVVPKALVEMSRTRMRETFAAIMVKRIYTLEFDRSTTVKPSMRRSLENAASNRGVVVATPTTLKSIMLSYIEVLQHLKESQSLGMRTKAEELKTQADELAKILKLFNDGVMLLDEVDLILHPLKSELNFPIGDKFDLDGSEEGERWSLPIHLLDAFFYTTTNKVSSFEQRGVALDILKRLAAIIQQGISERHLQRLPHITLLNVDFYHQTIKPTMAEWAYLWLQKQHLHGIDRSEAIRYLLEGAAARSDTGTKVNLIELALTKVKITVGEISPGPTPTQGYMKSLTEEEKENKNESMLVMKRQASITIAADSDLESLAKAQIKQLEYAKQVALDHKQLVNDIYDIDEQIEEHLRNGGRKLGELQGSIIELHKKISDLECPRDDSLDNSIVVWCSQAFASTGATSMDSAGAAVTPGESSVPTLCSLIEDTGLTVRRCSEPDEAISRARDLKLEGLLRCLIIGGDELGASCGPSCSKRHKTTCVRCHFPFENHSNHVCPYGGRGSFPPDVDTAAPKKLSTIQTMNTLTDAESPYARNYGALPSSRTAVYTAHCSMKEDERMEFWKLGTTVTDDSKQLLAWVSSIPPWNVPQSADEESEAKEEVVPDPLQLSRQPSLTDKQKLIELKAELEQLETLKNSTGEDDDNIRKKLQQKATDKNTLLTDSVNKRIAELSFAEEEFSALLSNSVQLDDDEVKKLYVGPQSGRDAALAIAWLETHKDRVLNSTEISQCDLKLMNKHLCNVTNELSFLRQMSLAAKVVAHVTSPTHKKLLNLCYNWLSTFLPHCLAKVNRVSFGLLTVEDCKAAILADPHVPRSRLKLGVPFVGKDVPSKSSEFAHPDVIIGVTILAYRYTGLRKDDFIDIVDGLTSQFSHEIGPARDRESSQRHEKWVFAAGGAVRGLKSTFDGQPWAITGATQEDIATKEVVQLKFLQKSNKEQIDKLFELIRFEPLVIHYYLQKTIFPMYMRSQRMKISASGQAVGGDMLVGKRVGFSGTPSDLLPQELGRCDYETGDDGMMLTTILDRNIASHEFLQDQWSVELLLERIATAESPRYHALIDTGALITGYSNQEVAKQLLDRGLSWCEGVVFLDDDDKQQVLVRATNRVVSADQCGVALERRFAFYDQIHTTGMDIKHVVNATAVITLGKDMVFRDYVQGAYRMRGIGMGQKIHVYIIPEVKELMMRELKDAVIPNNPVYGHVLEDVVAWLVINSLRSEQTQWTMLCLQNIGNLYRKNAFKCLLHNVKDFISGSPSEGAKKLLESVGIVPEEKSLSDDPAVEFINKLNKDDALKLFDESIDFSLEASVPDPIPFETKLRTMLDSNEIFLLPDQHAIGHSIMEVVGQFSMIEGSANRLDTEQEREQEQEQEKEVEARRDQQIEVEKFVDREFSRQEEVQRPWPFSMLAKPLVNKSVVPDHPFYPMKDFKLRHHEPLEFPENLYISSNYFNPNWTGLRRVKNVVMVLEYSPSTTPEFLRLKSKEDFHVQLSESQNIALSKAHTLLGFHAAAAGFPHFLSHDDLKHAIKAATDVIPSDEMVTSLMNQFAKQNPPYLALDEFRDLLTCGILYPEHIGRHWVALSLAEAETIRRILHVRKKKNPEALINHASTEVALRYSPMCALGAPLSGDGGVVFDASWGWQRNGTKATSYEAAVAHNSFRFFDCDMHFSSSALNILVRVLHGSIRDRERFFQSTVACRRRMERKTNETPLAKVFMVPDEWVSLKQQAQAAFIIEALKARNLTLWEAFTAIDYDNNGILSPSEFYGALVWLGVPDLTAEDVVDFIEAADKNRDGMVDYREYMDMLSSPEDRNEEEDPNSKNNDNTSDEPDQDRVPIAKIEPYGAEELREIMVHRKQLEQAQQREERLRKQAYAEALDVKVFEEELEASRLRKGGANPAVTKTSSAEILAGFKASVVVSEEASSIVTPTDAVPVKESNEILVTDFKFSTNQHPLRFAPSGKNQFLPIHYGTLSESAIKIMKCKKNHTLNAYTYYWDSCRLCRKRDTHWVCWQCYYFVCSGCYEGDKRAQEFDRRDCTKHSTFLRCLSGCSFTLQIPMQGGAHPGTGAYSLSMELRVEKLPPKGHMQSLLRFSIPDLTQARKLHRTSVYLNGDGCVVGKPIESGGEVESAVTNKVRVRPAQWSFIFVSVNPEKGQLRSYVNGQLCHESVDLDPVDLRLHHKLVILGGGKQAHVKGGDVRRVVIYGDELDADCARALYYKLSHENPGVSFKVTRIQAIYKGWIQRVKKQRIEEAERKVIEEEKRKEEEEEAKKKEAEAAAAAPVVSVTGEKVDADAGAPIVTSEQASTTAVVNATEEGVTTAIATDSQTVPQLSTGESSINSEQSSNTSS
eukprot:gene4031-5768_t